MRKAVGNQWRQKKRREAGTAEEQAAAAAKAAAEWAVEAAVRAARWRNLDVRLGLSCPALRPLCSVGWSAVLQAAKDAERKRQRELRVRLRLSSEPESIVQCRSVAAQ
jgi:hypothetical protein